jgi:hypothetical protein
MALQKMIEQGLLLVQGDPQHDLKLGFRCRLLSSFGEIDGARCPRSGQIKRVKLPALSVEKVLPLRDSGFPADRSLSGLRRSQARERDRRQPSA